MSRPVQPKLFHIVHIDRLASIIACNGLLSDSQIVAHAIAGTTIGMSSIKQRRLQELTLNSYPDLYVGQCVPFYFCPRSIMLYLIHQANHPELDYRSGQEPIVHLQVDLLACVQWATEQRKRWAFTLSNAGSYYFEDRCDLVQLSDLDWSAINARNWQACKESKQAEFLVEHAFPWHLIEAIGVKSQDTYRQVINAIAVTAHRPSVIIKPEWYY